MSYLIMFKNTVKTLLLLVIMMALFGYVGFYLGGTRGVLFALIFTAVINLYAWWGSARKVLKMYRAQPIENGRIYQITEELVLNAHLPMPELYMIETDQPNAFATGRNPNNAAVAVSRGLVDRLNENELRGVIAHELAHIKHRDTLTMTVVATMAGALTMLSRGMMYSGSNSRQTRGRPSPIFLILMIVAPIIAVLIKMMISRTREYEADREGAEMANDPLALASALGKIEHYARGIRNDVAETHPATAHLFVINPLNFNPLKSIFSTHPPTAKRIQALKSMVVDNDMIDDLGDGVAPYLNGDDRNNPDSSLGPGHPWS